MEWCLGGVVTKILLLSLNKNCASCKLLVSNHEFSFKMKIRILLSTRVILFIQNDYFLADFFIGRYGNSCERVNCVKSGIDW